MRWIRAGCAVVTAAVLVERLHALVTAPPTDFDDAYMFWRYAGNLLAGHGIAWNPGGPPTWGVTSFLHLFVVTALRRFSSNDARMLMAASTAAGLLAAIALGLVCARFARLWRGEWLMWGAIILPLVCYTESFWFHATTGMDTMIALAANVGVVAASLWLAEAPSRNRAIVAAVVGYLAIQARPDTGLYALLCPLLLAGPRRWFLAVFAALVAVDTLAKWRYFGTPVPLSFLAKQPHYYGGFAGEYSWNPFLFLKVFLSAALPFVAALLLSRPSRRAIALLIPTVLTLAFFFSINQVMGHLGRFSYPSLPLLVVAAALSVEKLPRWPQVAVTAVVLLAGGPALEAIGHAYEARATADSLPLNDPDTDSWTASQRMAELAAALPPGTRIALSEHGLVGARAPQAILIDVLGLHDREFARHGFSAAELWRRDPDILWLPHPDHTRMLREIMASPELWARYDVNLSVLTYGIAVRKTFALPSRMRWIATGSGASDSTPRSNVPPSRMPSRRGNM